VSIRDGVRQGWVWHGQRTILRGDGVNWELGSRFRELEDAGVVVREEAPPPIATTLFRLTERGRELEAALLQLGLWGAPMLAHRAKGETLRIDCREGFGPPSAVRTHSCQSSFPSIPGQLEVLLDSWPRVGVGIAERGLHNTRYKSIAYGTFSLALEIRIPRRRNGDRQLMW
jgi:hypothetical protein